VYHIHSYPVDDQFNTFGGIGFQKADDTVCIADGGYFRRGDDKCSVCSGDGILKSLFDTGRAI
jgi:hypothetical protein